MSLQHRRQSPISFSPFGSPASSPLIGGKFFYQKPPISPQPTTSSCETTPATPSSSLLQPENQRFFDSSDLKSELQISTPIKKSEYFSKLPPLSPSSLVHTPTLAGTEMYTIFEEDSGSQSGSFENEKTLPSTKNPEKRNKLTRQNAVLFGNSSETSTKDCQVGGNHMKRNSLPSLKHVLECQENNDSKDPPSLEQRKGLVISKDTCSNSSATEFPSLPRPLLRRRKMYAISADTFKRQPGVEKPFAVEHQGMQSNQSEQEETSEDSEGGDMLSQSMPTSLLTSELHKQQPTLAEHRSTGKEHSHKRKHSLPIHIQRMFPDLVPKAQSPLVLHEMRSPPTSAESIRRCSSPFPTSTATSSESSDEWDRPVLCGGFSFMTPPRTSPKGPRKHSASPNLSPSKSPMCSQSKEDQTKKPRTIETSSPTKQGNRGYVVGQKSIVEYQVCYIKAQDTMYIYSYKVLSDPLFIICSLLEFCTARFKITIIFCYLEPYRLSLILYNCYVYYFNVVYTDHFILGGERGT